MKAIVIIVCCALLMSLATFGVKAQEGNWSDPVALSGTGPSVWFPSIEADVYGVIHVAWAENNAPIDSVMYTNTNDGTTWNTPNDIIAIPQTRGSEATRPDLLYNRSSELLHLTYHYYDIYAAEADITQVFDPNQWSQYALINDPTQNAYYAVSELDGNFTQHLLATWNRPDPTCGVCYHVFYRQRSIGEKRWSDPVDISQENTGAAKPVLFIDDQDYLHAIWEASDQGGGAYGRVERPSYIVYTRSTDGGTTWSEPINLGTGVDESRNPAISQDANGQLIVAWLELPDDEVFYQISTDGGETWSEPDTIPGVFGGFTIFATTLDIYSMASDSDGNVHLVFVGRTSAGGRYLELIHVVWNGSEWSNPEIIASYSGDAPEWPQLEVSNGNILNVVWFLRDEANNWDPDHGNYSIWYSRAVTSSTQIEPEQLPTPIPTATEIAVPEMTATSQIIPTYTVVSTIPSGYIPGKDAVYKETDYLKIVGMTLLPVLAFVVLVVIVVLYRKRKF
ncbi:MAG TPA: sialidase family protein [Anaerolineaceae bacterium]|nr:sialidase family protein [Anaerolineaceae bacterium]